MLYYLNVKPKYKTKVDKDDYEKYKNNKIYYSHGYAYVKDKILDGYLHRIINNPSKNQIVDHINRDKLDNRKSNLRNISIHANSLNRKNNNVKPIQRNNKYLAYIKFLNQTYYLGSFTKKEDAENIINKFKILINFLVENNII